MVCTLQSIKIPENNSRLIMYHLNVKKMNCYRTNLLLTLRGISLHLVFFMLLIPLGCDLVEEPLPPNTDLPQLSFLEGNWIRIDGNNANADGMKVEVRDDYSVITDPSNTSLSLGDVKWKSITPSAKDLYEHQELGSDGNYYSATITIVDDDEIEINVAAGGAGNFQRWVRYNPTDLDKLQGPWTRIESNNPQADFMRVEVDGDEATITDKANSGFSLGDIKWRSITASGNDLYSHQELGSDNNYYDGTITLVNDSTLEISVVSSGSGNTQKWVRNPPAGPATTLDCTINTPTTLTNGPGAVDYVVDCVVDVTAALTIEPGVVIEFAENGGIGVYDNGSINAIGTNDEQIVFRSTTGDKGYWRGIHVETNSSSNSFDNVVIQDAGSNYVYCCNEIASLFIKGGQFSIVNSRIENGAGMGMLVKDAAKLSDYRNVVITAHDDYPMSLSMERAGELDGLSSDYSGNAKPYIEIRPRQVKEPTVIQPANVPFYLAENVLDIIQNLTLNAGTELVMGENTGLGVYDNGSLKIQGTSSDPVKIRGYEPIAGYWRGIHMETNSLSNDIRYAEISEAGSNYVYCCNEPATILFKKGSTSISKTTLKNGGSYGIYAGKDFEFRLFEDNVITTHDDYPMYIAAERIGELDGINSKFTGNDKDYIGVYNSDIKNEITWPKTDIPYFVQGVLDITARIDIEKGTEVVFEENAGLGVYDSGILSAKGTAAEKIVFRGIENSQGYWRGIHIETNSINNALDHVSISNAGSNYVYCCNSAAAVFVKGAKLSISNCRIADSGGCGIFETSGSDLSMSSNTFLNNADGDICS